MLQILTNSTQTIYLNFGGVTITSLSIQFENCLTKATTTFIPTFVTATERAYEYQITMLLLDEGQYICRYYNGVNEIWRGLAFIRSAVPYATNEIVEYNNPQIDYVYE
jgi:hypothetical protein